MWGATEKSELDAATAVPESVELCVPTESTTERDAVKVPAVDGVNVTDTVHAAPDASDAPQLLEPRVNEEAFDPLSEMEVIGSAAVPALVNVMIWATLALPGVTLPKLAVAGVNAACGAAMAVPIPDSDTVCVVVVEPELSVTTRLAVKARVAAGLKTMLTVQLEPAASVVPQAFVCVKNDASAPARATEVMVSGAVPVLDSVACWATELVPWIVEKDSETGVSDAMGTPATVPVRDTL